MELAKDETSRGVMAARSALAAGLASGILADFLLWEQNATGPGLAVLVVVIALAAQWLNRHEAHAWRQTLGTWSLIALTAAVMLAARDSPPLAAMMLFVMLSCAAMVVMQAERRGVKESLVRDHLQAFLFLPLRMFTRLIPLLRDAEFGSARSSRRMTGIVRGLVLVAPLLLVFIALFSSADETFGRFAARLGDMLSLSVPRHLLLVLMFSTLATGLLLCTFLRTSSPEPRRINLALGNEETVVILGALCVLFLVFVVLQMSYLFGGRATIEMSGLTLAGYARRGFFELLAAGVLTLSVLLLISGTRCNQALFRPLALVLVLCVLIMLASAAQRLGLYMEQFGLTFSRVLAVAVMIWLAVNLVSFTVTILRGNSRGFAAGMMLSGILIVLLLAISNPAGVVARVNMEHASHDNPLDVDYLLTLGADAVPAMLSKFDLLSGYAQCTLAAQLLARWDSPVGSESFDWRSWNYGRAAARAGVAADRERLRNAVPYELASTGSRSSALIPMCP